MTALTLTFHEPRVSSTFNRDVLNRIVSEKVASLRIIGMDSTPEMIAALGDALPVMVASDVPTAKLRSHVVTYLKGKGYKVNAARITNDADDSVIAFTLHVRKSK